MAGVNAVSLWVQLGVLIPSENRTEGHQSIIEADPIVQLYPIIYCNYNGPPMDQSSRISKLGYSSGVPLY
jgi:hypothetical protein